MTVKHQKDKITFCKVRKSVNEALYSSGGSMPSWVKTGKTWSGTGPLRNHLRIIYPKTHSHFYDNAVVEFFEYELKAINTETLADFKNKGKK